MKRLTTRHSESFDILTECIDPSKSPYARGNSVYVEKVSAFYEKLGIKSAVWTNPEDEQPRAVESCKPIEYLLEVHEDRIVAYVNELTWSPYLYGERQTFEYSRTRMRYGSTSILVAAPIRSDEIKEFRRYRQINGPLKFELVERKPWPVA